MTNVCKNNEFVSHEQQCVDLGGTPACAICDGCKLYDPWNVILPGGCLDMCIVVCEFE